MKIDDMNYCQALLGVWTQLNLAIDVMSFSLWIKTIPFLFGNLVFNQPLERHLRVQFRILWIFFVRETTERRACLCILLRQSSNKAVGGLWEMILSCWFNDRILCLSQQQNEGKEEGANSSLEDA